MSESVPTNACPAPNRAPRSGNHPQNGIDGFNRLADSTFICARKRLHDGFATRPNVHGRFPTTDRPGQANRERKHDLTATRGNLE